MSDTVDTIWQAELITRALEAGQIDESQAALLAVLYFKANWSTRVIADFRAERACQWLGRDPNYASTMRKRLQTLRELGWFEWTYKQGVKTPYDITMASEQEMCAPPAPHAPYINVTNTLAVKFTGSTGESTPSDTTTLSVTRTPCGSSHAGGAPLRSEAPALRRAIYTATSGELVDRLLTPSQIDDLLDRHTVAEIEFAVLKRVEKVQDRRELHRSLRSFLLDGGIQIELDTAEAWLKETLERANGWFLAGGRTTGRPIVETPAQRIERITKKVKDCEAELKLFPNLVISGDVGSIIVRQEAVQV